MATIREQVEAMSKEQAEQRLATLVARGNLAVDSVREEVRLLRVRLEYLGQSYDRIQE